MTRRVTVASAVAVLCVTICLPLEPVESFSGGLHNLRRGVLSGDENYRSRNCKLSVGRQSLALASAVDANSLLSESHKIRQDASLFDDSMENFVPATKSLSNTVIFFARYVAQAYKHRLQSKYEKKKSLSLRSRRQALMESCQRLNEQRKNLVMLAGWGAEIVVPSFTFLILGAFMTSVVPHYSAKCMQLVATLHPARKNVIEALVGLFVTSSLAALFTGCRGSLFWLAGSRTNYNVRVKLHRKLLLQEAAFFDSNETGYLLSRLNNDVNKIGQVVSFHVNIVCRQTAQFLFGAAYLLHLSRPLALWTFAGIGFVAWMSAVYGRFANHLATEVQDTFASATAVAETSLSMSETIRAFDGVKVESNRYEQAQGSALELEEVQACAYGAHKFASDTVQYAMYVMLMLACWKMGRAGGLAAEKLTSFLFYANFVLESSNEVGDQWAKIQGAVGASSSVFELITRVPAVRDPPKRKDVLEITDEEVEVPAFETHVNGHTNGVNLDTVDKSMPVIEAANVTLTYNTMEVPALDGVDLNIHERDRVAIVGRSGSGKSSMLRAMLRFYDPSSGNIKLNGEKMTDLTRKEIANQVAVVEQEPSLFPLSLVDNVLYGMDKNSVDENGEPCYSEELRSAVADSLQLCGLPVSPGNSLGLELDTRVGEGGRTLSGGQRQRTAIARALIRKPDVLLLDEPTAALDSQSEKLVIMALKQAMERSKSMVMVTHRLGVVRALDVNRVIVMEKGKIVESGNPEELLLREDGLYASLAREQGIKPIERSATKSATLHSPVNM